MGEGGIKRIVGVEVPDEAVGFGRRVADRLDEGLDGALVGAYFVGSVALGGYVAGQSDLDIVAVSGQGVPLGRRAELAEGLLELTPDCPARGLEFTLYSRQVAAGPPQRADFELNVNGGPAMARSIHLDEAIEPGFWYVLDRAIAHRSGVVITGPAPSETFLDVPRQQLLVAMSDSMRWHREHEGATLYSVLNACRAWRFAAEDVLGSKLAGASWAKSRWPRSHIIDSAVDLRSGRPAELDGADVGDLLDRVESELSQAISLSA